MRRYRKLLISALLLAAVGAAAVYLYQRYRGPAESVRVLPEGDLLIYVNFRPIHLWDLNKSKPVQLESEYQGFVEQTGIQFERDLDEVAMSRRDTADGRDVESAEVFVGRFDANRLQDYLQKKSIQTESYRGHTVYLIPNEGHTVRIALLDGARVAVTNMVAAEPMHGMIDRFHHASGGPSLLGGYYRHVPVASLAWMIDRIPANSDAPQLPGGLNFSFLGNTVAVASLRYNGAVLFRADVFPPSEEDARRVAESANAFLVMSRSVSRSLGTRGADPDVKAALDSIEVEQKGSAAVFTAAFSEKFVKKILSENQPEGLAVAPATPEPQQIPKR
jgi:hypothetical protein